MKWIIGFILVAIVLADETDCHGKQNTNEVLKAVPEFVKSVTNGRLYHMKNKDEIIKIITVKGTAYDEGKAIGELIKEDIKENLGNLMISVREKVKFFAKKYLPEFIINPILWLVEKLFYWALNVTWIITKDYTPKRYFEEIRGMAEGSGIPYMDLVRAAMFPELIKAACSLVGAWGSATEDHNALFLRALDWEVDMAITKYPVITVYFSSEEGSIPFASLGYAGLVGTFTAVNAKGLAVGEKYWYRRTEQEATTTRAGKPWNFVMRDMAQFDDNIATAINKLNMTKRTCSIHLGIVSSKDNEYRGVRYSYDHLKVYSDKNSTHTDPRQSLIEGASYWDKHTQPSGNTCLSTLIKQKHGHIDAKFMYEHLAARHQTGNCQAVVFDMKKMEMYFAYSSYSTQTMAYDKPMFFLDLKKLFEQMKPQLNI